MSRAREAFSAVETVLESCPNLRLPSFLRLRASAIAAARARRVLPLVLVVAAVGSCSGDGVTARQDGDRWCSHRYRTGDDAAPVCSTVPLEEAQLSRLARQLDEVKALYPRFAASCGVPFDPSALVAPTLHVIRYDEINDRAAFPRAGSVGNILGRYYVGRAQVFITERALEEGGGFHLPHELAHWIHDRSGVSDADEDERLARAFHRYYRAHMRAERAASREVARADVSSNADLLLAHSDDDGPSTRDRSLAERADGPFAVPLYDDLCGR